MKRILFLLALLTVLSVFSIDAGAAIVEVDRSRTKENKVTLYCIQNLMFVIVATDVGEGGGAAITQVYEEKDGKVVPKKCAEEVEGWKK